MNDRINSMSMTGYFQLALTLVMALSLPVGSTAFLIKRKDQLLKDDYISSFGTLYSNLKTF